MFRKYTIEDFSHLRKQHNIMVLVGNGFDIALLKRYGPLFPDAYNSTTYEKFYDFITEHEIGTTKNGLYLEMSERHSKNLKNWSDFENIVDELLRNHWEYPPFIEESLDEIQSWFTDFLNHVVTTSIILRVNSDAKSYKWSVKSLSKFLKDLVDKNYDMNFKSSLNHYHLYNYLFFNFNYTMLLDDYLYLDKKQFDPIIHKTIDTNFYFYPRPGYFYHGTETTYSSYILMNVIHPHGIQYIPRSIIFGTDVENNVNYYTDGKRLVKSYWAQYDLKYKAYFQDTELFIIFGMSLSKTDGWWMDQIFSRLSKEKAELLLYFYNPDSITNEEIKNQFFAACIRHQNTDERTRKIVYSRIFVISFKNSHDHVFLGLNDK